MIGWVGVTGGGGRLPASGYRSTDIESRLSKLEMDIETDLSNWGMDVAMVVYELLQ